MTFPVRQNRPAITARVIYKNSGNLHLHNTLRATSTPQVNKPISKPLGCRNSLVEKNDHLNLSVVHSISLISFLWSDLPLYVGVRKIWLTSLKNKVLLNSHSRFSLVFILRSNRDSHPSWSKRSGTLTRLSKQLYTHFAAFHCTCQ